MGWFRSGVTVVVVLFMLGTCTDQTSQKPSLPRSEALVGQSAKSGERAADFEYALPLNPHELEADELDRLLNQAESAGVNSIVTGAVWWYMAPQEGRPLEVRDLDRLVTETERRGLGLRLQISGTPDWVHPELRSSEPEHAQRIWYPPRSARELEEFESFVEFLVGRYGTRVGSYEIWNEPNSVDFWKPSPSPEEYAALLRASYFAAKRTDPKVIIQFGGLSMNDAGYLEDYYRAASQYPEAEDNRFFFDMLGVHPYTYGRSPDWLGEGQVEEGTFGPVDTSFTGMERLRTTMEHNSDGNKPFFIGEFGYSTEETWMPPVPDHVRALYLKRSYEIAQRLPYVTGMAWYAFAPESTVGTEWTLLDENLRPNSTHRALRQSTGAEDRGVTVRLPGEREIISGEHDVLPRVSGIKASHVQRWELYVDGNLMSSDESLPLTLDTRELEDGVYGLLVAAYTRDGSVWASEPAILEVHNTRNTER